MSLFLYIFVWQVKNNNLEIFLAVPGLNLTYFLPFQTTLNKFLQQISVHNSSSKLSTLNSYTKTVMSLHREYLQANFVWLTSYFTWLESAALLMLNELQIYLFCQMQTS